MGRMPCIVMVSDLGEVEVLDNVRITLIDSGADVSLCSYQFLRKIISIVSHPRLGPVVDVVLMDYTGTWKKNIYGEIVIPVKIGSKEVYWKFYVLKGLNHHLLIGKDFVNRY